MAGRLRNHRLPKATKPELILKEILVKNKIKFKKNYKLCYDIRRKLNRYYDFYLSDYNILVEVDGDYFHGNPDKFTKLNEMQLKNQENDKFKNELAILYNIPLFRFWESDIIKGGFEKKFLKKINGKS